MRPYILIIFLLLAAPASAGCIGTVIMGVCNGGGGQGRVPWDTRPPVNVPTRSLPGYIDPDLADHVQQQGIDGETGRFCVKTPYGNCR